MELVIHKFRFIQGFWALGCRTLLVPHRLYECIMSFKQKCQHARPYQDNRVHKQFRTCMRLMSSRGNEQSTKHSVLASAAHEFGCVVFLA